MIDYIKQHGLTWLEHAVICLFIQSACGFLLGEWVWSALVALAFFVGRECAQVEDHGRSDVMRCYDGHYRRCHINSLNSLPIGYGMNLLRWSADSIMDIVVPALLCGGNLWVWA